MIDFIQRMRERKLVQEAPVRSASALALLPGIDPAGDPSRNTPHFAQLIADRDAVARERKAP